MSIGHTGGGTTGSHASPKYNGRVWQCAADDDTDTLSGLNCIAHQIAVSDSSGNWNDAVAPTTFDLEDTVAAIEAVFCRSGEKLHRDMDGEDRCEVV